ncbi:MAG: carbon storage regulator CsrA [Ruminococcus sp.]|nr:carbon storage regulator CsrA [Ruminococcus sp.]MBO5383744.1 carbon storage regulator CsrA [Ruminococcus sp.]MBR6669613.1 carbon storage regulator CsrA [Ruminococcus sp.]
MLVLSRKIEESILIGENIEIKILDVTGDKVQIGITAPKEVTVLRSELKETIEENKSSATGASKDLLQELFGKK